MSLKILILSVFCFSSVSAYALQMGPPPAESPAAPETLDALQKFNLTFRENYAWRRKREVAALPTLVWAIGDKLVLYRRSERVEANVIPKVYHVLKAFAHIPLTVQVTLEAEAGKELTGEALQKVQALLPQIQGLRSSVDSYELKRPTADRQRAMIDASTAVLSKALEAKKVNAAELTAFSRKMRVGVMANVAEAARAQIDSMYAQMKSWRTAMTPAEWKEMKVAVSGPSMPRIGNLTTQFFAKLLKEKGEGRRIIYTEWAWDENTLFERIGTDLVDTKIAAAFFGDDRRMHRDLLSDAATAILKNYPMD